LNEFFFGWKEDSGNYRIRKQTPKIWSNGPIGVFGMNTLHDGPGPRICPRVIEEEY
jgi:hypothetical protein